MQYRWILLTPVFFLAMLPPAIGKEGSSPRARPPAWTQDVREAFFDDAREHLVGDRPSTSDNAKQVATIPEDLLLGKGQAWSALVDAETLVIEIKRATNRVANSVPRATEFKVEGYRLCQRDFRLLAIWFSVVREFDVEVRWQANAGAMGVYLRSVASQCQSGSDESLSVAREASEVLAELMRGQTPTLRSWANSATIEESDGLDAIMQRMKQATEKKIAIALDGAKEFRKARNDVAHEAQIVAVLAQVIRQEGFDYSEDETYLEYAQQLEKAAVALRQAVRNRDYAAAEQAHGQMKQSCANCHEDYRG